MPPFDVEIYPVMLLRITGVEAQNTESAIAAAMVEAEAVLARPESTALAFAHEVVRYIVEPVVDGQAAPGQGAIYLDREHVEADARDRHDGFPLYSHVEAAAWSRQRQRHGR